MASLWLDKIKGTHSNSKIGKNRNIITNLTERKTIIREYYEPLNTNKLGILDEMEKFPEIQNCHNSKYIMRDR